MATKRVHLDCADEACAMAKHVHPASPGEAFTYDEFKQWAQGIGYDDNYAIRLFEEACPVELAHLGEDPRVHPMAPTGKTYSYIEYFQFAEDINIANKMWNETTKVKQETESDFGNWSGVVSRPPTEFAVATTFPSSFDEPSHLQRSLSMGSLTAKGEARNRHPNGHPTAIGHSWIGAT